MGQDDKASLSEPRTERGESEPQKDLKAEHSAKALRASQWPWVPHSQQGQYDLIAMGKKVLLVVR